MTAFASCIALLGCVPAMGVMTAETPTAEYLKADAPPISWKVRMGGTVGVDVPNPKVTFEVGKQLPLFQQSENSYVAITRSSDGNSELTVFPRYVGNEPSAWVSVENILVFGRRTTSIRGQFTFETDEMVPLIRETPDDYVVDVQRLGHHMPLTISKKTSGVVLVPVQQPERAASAASRSAVITTKSTPSPSLSVPPPRVTPESVLAHAETSTGDASSELAVAKIKEEFIKDLMGELEKVKQQHAVEEARKAAELAAMPPPVVKPVEPAVVIQKVEVPVKAPAPEPAPYSQWTFLSTYAHDNAITLILIGVGAIVLPVIIIAITRIRSSRTPARARAGGTEGNASNANAPLATEVFTFSSVGESTTSDSTTHTNHGPTPAPAAATNHGDLSGTLSGHILPQVVQFFCAARESGKMTIRQESGLLEELLFNNGQIIDARTGSIVGKDAARAILQQRDGKFSFHRANTSNDKRQIHDETMSLLLEAHQALDESRRTRHGT